MTATTVRADELRLLDDDVDRLSDELHKKSLEAMRLYVSLLIDEMLDKAAELGQSDDLSSIISYYFGSHKFVLQRDKSTYFGQLHRRVPNGRISIEPFASCFNEEVKRRGANVALHSDEGGWYGTIVISTAPQRGY
jgi:hypothetical protein